MEDDPREILQEFQQMLKQISEKSFKDKKQVIRWIAEVRIKQEEIKDVSLTDRRIQPEVQKTAQRCKELCDELTELGNLLRVTGNMVQERLLARQSSRTDSGIDSMIVRETDSMVLPGIQESVDPAMSCVPVENEDSGETVKTKGVRAEVSLSIQCDQEGPVESCPITQTDEENQNCPCAEDIGDVLDRRLHFTALAGRRAVDHPRQHIPSALLDAINARRQDDDADTSTSNQEQDCDTAGNDEDRNTHQLREPE